MSHISNLTSHPDSYRDSPKKILIRLPNWLGDVVMSSAFVGVVKSFYPDAVIDAIAKKELAGAAGLIAGLSQLHLFSKRENPGLKGAYHFGKQLKTEKYDLFFNLPESFSSQLMAKATGAKRRVGFSKEGSFFLLTDRYKKPANVHRVEEYVSLAEQFTGKKIERYEVKLDVAKPAKPVEDVVIINFNSEASSRRMPPEKAIHIINVLTGTFTKTHFTFIGTKKEDEFIEQIIQGAENADRLENIAGKTDLMSLAHILGVAAVVLTTDSGPAHLANSAGAPTIVLFGAGNEQNTAPYNKQDLHIIRYGKLDCEPCVKNTCKLYGIPKCMQLLDEMQIVAALKTYLPNG
ncbi:MAG TPA: glycosyltransferase family 9 protein [Mucilaginibacter sp.]|jgi:lipopolysaccharide heptosyltransferase II|nr:glycosyltransferase family 9 protein [Mucilaginibacter sp.]